MNILVIHELYDDQELMVYELPEDDHAAAAEALKIFLLDVDAERREGSSVDPNNTWWDAGGQYGQLTWTSGRRVTYDVTCTCPLPQTGPKFQILRSRNAR